MDVKQDVAHILPENGRALVYMTQGAITAILPLKESQIVADTELMIVLLRRMGYDVRRK